MCDRISGGEFLDRYSEKTGFITAYCGICREWNYGQYVAEVPHWIFWYVQEQD